MPRTRMKSPDNLKWPAECRSETPIPPLNFGEIGLGTLICPSKFTFESLFLRHAHCKTENKRMHWGEWGVSISYAQFLIGSPYDWLGADLSPASRGCTKPRMKNLWHPMNACARHCAFLLPITPIRGSMRDDWGRFIVGCSHSKFGAR